jgi:hypothetical protein
VPDRTQVIAFDTFDALVEHLRTHPDFDVAEHTKMGVGFELVERSKTELVGVMAYKRNINGNTSKFTTFKVKGPLPDLSATGWYIDFTTAV